MSENPKISSSRRIKYRRKHKRSFKRIFGRILAGLLVLLATATWLFVLRDGSASHQRQMAALPSPTASTTGNPRALVHLPADDAPHHNTTEWWYYNGHLHTDAGQRYAYHVAVFLRRELADHTMFHVSLVDLQTGKHYTGQARTEGIPSLPKKDGFDFSYAGWQVAGSGPKHALNITMKGFSFKLDLDDVHPPTLHQAPGSVGPGELNFGPAGNSFYYSRMRIPTQGTLTVGGVSKPVTGQSWFDHQWGDFLSTDVGWNWFAIQLDDGADIMLYQVFDPHGKILLQAGTYSRDGHVVALGKDDYAMKSLGSWTSPDSKDTYPVDWALSIPSQKLELTVKPFVNACEFNGLETILKIYWEGPIQITGTRQGVGYLELSGYNKTSNNK